MNSSPRKRIELIAPANPGAACNCSGSAPMRQVVLATGRWALAQAGERRTAAASSRGIRLGRLARLHITGAS